MSSLTSERISGRMLIPEILFDTLTDHIVKHERIERPTAERIMADSLAFLKACADHPRAALSPSKAVDIGWHTFILHTREYAEFCQRVAGRFIQHRPTGPGETERPETLERTVAAMKASGMMVHHTLWADIETTDCTQCHAGCTDGP